MSTGKALVGKPYAGNPHVRFDEGESHHAPQRLRPKVEIARASRRAYLRFGGYIAEGNPKGAAMSAVKGFCRGGLMDLMASGVACAIGMMAFSTACGAPPPGNLDIQRMIDKAAERGGTVRVPAGEWEVKPFVLKSNVTLALADGARLLASTNKVDYPTNGECPVFIFADCATNVAIVGKGVIDGRGGAFKETARLRGETQPKTLPLLMRFSRCRDLRLEGFHYINPGSWACHLRNCDGVMVKGVSCFCHCNRMNDGLDIESSNVTIEDCVFDTDDDALCFKTESDRTFPVTNIVVRNCRMGSVCNGIKFGTGSYNVFRDITIENCAVVRPGAAFRFDWRKSIPGVTNRLCGISGLAMEVVDGGGMENVTVRGLTIEGYQTPIFIRHHHRHERVGGEEPYLRNILIENVRGTAESRIASSITGVLARKGASARRPRDITLRNVSLVAPGGGTAGDAAAKVPEKDGAYPESFMFGKKPLPAYGFYVRHADNIIFENVEITTVLPDAREKFVFEDCSGCCTYGRADVESKSL